ncbi:MAG TPA: carbon monoxide dehydrogenase subunit G, partial [Blastocatellia bacterium]|nr:carbon monoxide dehydrogenase subunit G [Blastocatellia bacterium]
MKVEGSYTIKASRTRLWPLMIDPAVLSRCVPGCQSLEAQEDGSYKMTMKAGVGSIKGLSNGLIRLDDIREPERYKMIVEGKGAPGFVKGEGALDLAEQGEETVVTYAGEVNVGGTLA